ncbi:nuclear transport factor 2 family protein [Nocardia sp. NBC_00565]|uniref:nuclear transport factor 2 family protein n=1 Tax=Nocardia sp. NBC_00565 TaxID=2975993 RepID=UPI002E8053A3|nr:nuclear transport factor 2 family protein [Nocardia sp. NBC_00565]WUC05286.1 nuclear transport factor 2 family protein [Nocardia sp. NBC_00565]
MLIPNDFRSLADRIEIEALRGEFPDAVMMRDFDRLASLFTDDGVLRIPDAGIELAGRADFQTKMRRMQDAWDYFIQHTHPGAIDIDGDTASGRAHICELGRLKTGSSHLNYAIYHDRYRRTADGWKFAERVYEIRYLDNSPLAGSPLGENGLGVDVSAVQLYE